VQEPTHVHVLLATVEQTVPPILMSVKLTPVKMEEHVQMVSTATLVPV